MNHESPPPQAPAGKSLSRGRAGTNGTRARPVPHIQGPNASRSDQIPPPVALHTAAGGSAHRRRSLRTPPPVVLPTGPGALPRRSVRITARSAERLHAGVGRQRFHVRVRLAQGEVT